MGILAAEALVRGLALERVEAVFGYPGGAVLSLYDALLNSSIRHILVRQEQAAAHAASGYARTTGRPGVCMATSGPGATNLVTGVAAAHMDSVPLVIFTGQVATDQVGTDAFQEVDITGITIPITKHNYLIKDPEEIPRVVREAFHIARSGRPGPVLVDLPKNLMAAECTQEPPQNLEIRGYKPTIEGHPAQLRRVVRWLREARKPVIYAGGGVIISGAEGELKKLAESLSIPVTTTLMGIGGIPEDHPLALGMLGLHGRPQANLAVMNADLLLALGARFDDRVTGSVEKFAPNARVIHVDIDPAEIGKNVKVDLPVVGDVRSCLEVINSLITSSDHGDWLKEIATWREDYPLTFPLGEGLSPRLIVKELGDLTRDRAIITTDVGQHQMWVAQHYGFNAPRTFISSGGLGSMGYGFPAAIGAQIANPDATVVTVTGDGGFQMCMSELGTAMENNLPIKVLVFNNSCLGMVRQLQEFYCGSRYHAVFMGHNPDFVALAKSYGAEGMRITTNEEIRPVLKEALDNNRLTIIECVIPTEENVFPMVLSGTGLDEMVFLHDKGRKKSPD